MPTKKGRPSRLSTRALLVLPTLALWIIVGYILIHIPPDKLVPYYYAPVLGVLELTLLCSIFLLSKRWIISVVLASAITILIGLRLFDLKQWHYSILTLLLAITLIYFFTTTDKNDKVGTENLNSKSDCK